MSEKTQAIAAVTGSQASLSTDSATEKRNTGGTLTSTSRRGDLGKDCIEAGHDSAIEAGDIIPHHAGDGILIDAATDKKIRRKIDWHIIPWMFGLYFLQQFDKISLSYAAIMGVRDDLNLSNDQYAWSGSIFYLGYLAFEYPHNRAMQRFPLAKYISLTVIIWGIILTLHAAAFNFAGLMVVRFFLGAFEGSVTAGFVLMTARWYRNAEQATRTSFWFCANGMTPILGGAFAFAVAEGFLSNSNITFASWKVIFIVAGIITVLYGFALLYFLPSSPVDARWLSEEEKRIAVERLRVNQQSMGNKIFKWEQFREAFTDIRSWLYCIFCVSAMIPAGGITVFFTILIQGYGFNSRTSLLVTMPAGIVQLVTNLGIPWLAQKFKNRMLMASLGTLLSIFGISLMAGLARSGPTDYRIGQLVGYYIIYGNAPSGLILILSSVSTNVGGYTKKTTVNAMILISYCVGFLIGPQTFRDGPYYTNAKYNIIAMYSVALVCCVALLWINKRENRKRDAMNLPPQAAGQEFWDLTDKQNKYFRHQLHIDPSHSQDCHGQQAKSEILINIETYKFFFQETAQLTWAQAREKVCAIFLPVLRAKYPDILAEMAGIAAGVGPEVCTEDIILLNARSEIALTCYADGCTSVAERGRHDDGVWLCQNWDWLEEVQRAIVFLHIVPERDKGYEIKFITEAGIIGKIGANSAGLGVGMNALRSGAFNRDGLPVHCLSRWILQHCGTVREAGAAIESLGIGCTGNFLLADSTGDLMDVEASPHGHVVIRPMSKERPYILHTNHLCGSNRPAKLKDHPAENSFQRLRRIEELTETDRLAGVVPSFESMRKRLSDEQGYPYSICRDRPPGAVGMERMTTLATILMNLGEKRIQVIIGRPCLNGPVIEWRFDETK